MATFSVLMECSLQRLRYYMDIYLPRLLGPFLLIPSRESILGLVPIYGLTVPRSSVNGHHFCAANEKMGLVELNSPGLSLTSSRAIESTGAVDSVDVL